MLPSTIEVRVQFPAARPGETEPFISTGVVFSADFLNVRYLDASTAVFAYDAWASGGPDSEPFTLQPGVTRVVRVTMPSLDGGRGAGKRVRGPLTISIDGREVVNAQVHYFSRKGSQIFFGNNPIGGNTADGLFRGSIQLPDGRPLAGVPTVYFSFRERLAFWLTQHPSQVIALLLFAVGIGFAQPRLRAWLYTQPWARLRPHALQPHTAPPHLAFALTTLVCAVVFTAVMTGGTFRLLVEESFGNFYDHQAASLLAGKLDVPEPALSGEAFVVNGKVYGYYGIMPAVLRLPFVGIDALFGHLSRSLMLGYYLACLAAAYVLLVYFTRLACGGKVWPSRLATVLFVGTVGLGTSLLFLGSRAYVYHEAILCGLAFAVWSAYFSLRFFHEPARLFWLPALVTGLCALHARPPAGLFALTVLGSVAAWHLYFAWERRTGWLRYLLIGFSSVVAFASFNGLSYLKFGTFDGSPFRYAVQYTPERRARFNDRNFHFSNLSHNFDTYFILPDYALRPNFPYVFFDPIERGINYPGAKIDLEELTLALPYSMPALVALALGGGLWAICFVPGFRRPLTVVAVASVPMTLALGMAIVTSHRYTGDFCPLLIVFGAAGLAVLDAERRRERRLALGATGALAAASIFVTLALSLRFQGELVWGVPDDAKRNYEALRQSADRFFGVKPPSNK